MLRLIIVAAATGLTASKVIPVERRAANIFIENMDSVPLALFYMGNETRAIQGEFEVDRAHDYEQYLGTIQPGQGMGQLVQFHDALMIRKPDQRFRVKVALFDNTDNEDGSGTDNPIILKVRNPNNAEVGPIELMNPTPGYQWIDPGADAFHLTNNQNTFVVSNGDRKNVMSVRADVEEDLNAQQQVSATSMNAAQQQVSATSMNAQVASTLSYGAPPSNGPAVQAGVDTLYSRRRRGM